VLFDFLLVLIMIFFFFRSTAKATLESLVWILGVFLTIRISGMFYLTLAEILRGVFSVLDHRNSQYISYIIMLFLFSFIYIFFLRSYILGLARFIPARMLVGISFVSNLLMGFMVYVIIYATANSFPMINKLPPRVRNARSEILVVWTIGSGSVEFIKTMRKGLNEFDNPLDYLKDQQGLINKAGQKIKKAADSIGD